MCEAHDIFRQTRQFGGSVFVAKNRKKTYTVGFWKIRGNTDKYRASCQYKRNYVLNSDKYFIVLRENM